jgi:hypothetical protein
LAALLAAVLYFGIAGLKRQRVLVFNTQPQALFSGVTSEPLTVRAKDGLGRSYKVDRDITITVQSSSATGRFDMQRNGAFVASELVVVMPKGSDSVTFFYQDTVNGKPSITATHDEGKRWKKATQDQKVGEV